MNPQRPPAGGKRVLLAALIALATAPAACDREDRAEVNQTLDEVGQEIDEAVKEAEPVVEEGLQEAGEAVGRGIEAAGEVLQRAGEELQEESRDTTATTLPDTLGDSTMVLE